MNRKPTLLITLAVILLIGLAFRLGLSPGERALAQEAGPDAEKDALEAVNNVASRFTYQGLLQENGDPVTGTRNMTFRLYLQSTCTSYIGGSEITQGALYICLVPRILEVRQWPYRRVLVQG